MSMEANGDAEFEAVCLEALGMHYRHAGLFVDAGQVLNRALSVTQRWSMRQREVAVALELARLHIDRSDYAAAKALLAPIVREQTGRLATQARILMGRVYTRLGQFGPAGTELDVALQEIVRSKDDGLMATVNEALGELSYESGNLEPARNYFLKAAARDAASFADQAAVEAGAFLGLIDAGAGRTADAVGRIETSVKEAERMARVALAARSRVMLARAYLLAGRRDMVARVLGALPGDVESRLGIEARAHLHLLRSHASTDPAAGAGEVASARRLLEELRATLPESERGLFQLRTDVRAIIG
jgi:tetratricopeptide (TPR) repeat protein